MRAPLRMLAALLLLLALPARARAAWSDTACTRSGECGALHRRYAALVAGAPCLTLPDTGRCARVCLHSLRALLARRAWPLCARRCAWSPATAAAARDWLDWCEHRAEPEPPDQPAAAKGAQPVVVGEVRAGRRVAVIVAVAGIVVAVAVMGVARARWVKAGVLAVARRVVGGGKGRSGAGRGILDGAPDRSEIKRIAQGARRHLKAMRSNID